MALLISGIVNQWIPRFLIEKEEKRAWTNIQLATLEAGLKTTRKGGSSQTQAQRASGAREDHSKVRVCRKLCEEGQISDAVDALDLLVQRGCHVSNHLFFCALKLCIRDRDLNLGRRIHALSVKGGYEGDAFLATHIIGLYASLGRLEEATQVFSKVPAPDAYNWASIIFAYARHGDPAEARHAIRMYREMLQTRGVSPDNRIYSAVLKACASATDIATGKEVHAHVIASLQKPDSFVLAGLVDMYAKCGSLEDARRVFDTHPERPVVVWNAMIAGYAQQGQGREALNLYRCMKQKGVTPNFVTYVGALQACAALGEGGLDEGRQLHAHVKERGLQENVVVGGSVVNMYAKCGSLEDARRAFDRLPERNAVAWNTMLGGYVQQSMGQEAFSLYRRMKQEGLAPNSVTYVCLLQACASIGVDALDKGKLLHAQIKDRGLKEDMVVGCSLVNMYAKCGSLVDACRMFDRLSERSVVTWNAMLTGYAQKGMGQEALSLYRRMREEGLTLPDSVTYVCLLQACASVGVGALPEGKQLHAEIQELGLQGEVTVGSSLVNMYAKCGSLVDARQLFDGLLEKNIVTWNSMLACYAQQEMGQEALNLYTSMQQEGLPPNSVTFVCLLQACATVGGTALDRGMQLHALIKAQGLQENMAVGGSLVNMYVKCGSLEDARQLFDRLPAKNVVTWTAMLTGYAQQEMGAQALHLYSNMQLEGFSPPDPVTYACLLQACASVAALPLGKKLHAEIEERGMYGDAVVATALVNMYAKCGSMFDSQLVFDSLPERRVEAWGALIGGYARQGDSEIVFSMLEKMTLDGMLPDSITFLSVLTVCSHAGLLDKGREYFNAMSDYGITASVEHFICMIDLLGRAGHLEEALQTVHAMPFPPNGVVWHTLLGACQKWKNVKVGLQAFNGAVVLDENDAVSYVLMSNVYASAQMWEAAKEMRARRKQLGAWKKPGQSWWTDMAGVVHTFLVGDKEHPESDGIYARLEQLVPRMKKEGYLPDLQSSLLDLSDDQKEAGLCEHSEKLAIVYALNKTAEGTTIRIVKNLRVCEDCHTATTYISKIQKRTIICRDASRFHVFKDGRCSCGDYW